MTKTLTLNFVEMDAVCLCCGLTIAAHILKSFALSKMINTKVALRHAENF